MAFEIRTTESSPDALSTMTTRSPGSAATSHARVRRQSTTSPAVRKFTITTAVEREFKSRNHERHETHERKKISDQKGNNNGRYAVIVGLTLRVRNPSRGA